MPGELESCVRDVYAVDRADYAALAAALEGLCDFLSSPDEKVVLGTLNHVTDLLATGEGSGGANPYVEALSATRALDLIDQAQQHQSEEVYTAALNILLRFFEEDE